MPISPINRNLPVCRETNNSIDLDIPCKDHACVIYKNIVYQLSSQDDMFNYIYTADFRQIVVYSNKGRVYLTECDTISSFDLIQPQNCSKYVAVANMKYQSFNFKHEQTIGFLTRQMIIRLSIIQESCRQSPEIEEFGNYDKEFKVYKKADKVTITGRNDSSQAVDFDENNMVLDVYENSLDHSFAKLLKDLFNSIIGVFVSVVVIYKIIKKSKERCSKISKNTTNVSKKLCCYWFKRKVLLPTTIQKDKNSKFHTSAPSNAPLAPSAPSFSCAASYAPAYFDGTNMYHTIGNVSNLFPHVNQSTSALYQHRMPTRSCSNIYIKKEPGEVDEKMFQCPHCEKQFATKRGLAGHIVVHI